MNQHDYRLIHNCIIVAITAAIFGCIVKVQGVRKKDTHYFDSWCFRTWIGRFAWKRTFPANRLIRPVSCLSENSAGITERLSWHQIGTIVIINKILRKDMRLHPYRIQVHQKLTPEDRSRRVKMAQWFTKLSSAVSGSLTKRTSGSAGTWTRAARFTRGSSLPDKVLTKPLHFEKVTTWITMRREGGLIRPFFEDDRGGGSDN